MSAHLLCTLALASALLDASAFDRRPAGTTSIDEHHLQGQPQAKTRFCPSVRDLIVAYSSWRNPKSPAPELHDQGWTFRGGGGVATKSAFNLLGGWVEFDLDFSGTQAGVNANIYSISPKIHGSEFNKSRDYCDGGSEPGPGYCLEVDWIESNGHCGGASALHTVPGRNASREPIGCNAGGCRREYVYSSSNVHIRVEYDDQGRWAQIVGDRTIEPGEWSPRPNASDWAMVRKSYEKFGAVIYSSHWMGWSPCPSPCGCNNCTRNESNCTDILARSVYSVRNLTIYGSLVHGPTPTVCPPEPQAEVKDVIASSMSRTLRSSTSVPAPLQPKAPTTLGKTLRMALWAPEPKDSPAADPALAAAVQEALLMTSSHAVTVESITTMQLQSLQCGSYDVLVLPQAQLLPMTGGAPNAAHCKLPTACIDGLASTINYYLNIGDACSDAWRGATNDNVGVNSTHATCPSSAGKWGSSQQIRDCVPAVLAAANALNTSTCSPALLIRPIMKSEVASAIYRHAGGISPPDEVLDECAHSGHMLVMGKPPDILLTPQLLKAERVGEINVMSEYEPYQLRGPSRVVSTEAGLALHLPPTFGHAADWHGLSAIGFADTNDRFVPLLQLHDKHNRTVGWAGSALVHNSTKPSMGGSRWLLFGISNSSFYTHAAFSKALGPLAATFFSGEQTAPALEQHSQSSQAVLPAEELEPARLPQLRLGKVLRGGLRHFVFTDPQTGMERRWFMFGANIYRNFNFGPLTANEINLQFAALHAAGANAIRAFGWEGILEQPDLLAAALRAARTYGIRVLTELACKPEKDPQAKTQAGTINATIRAATALRDCTDVFFAFDLCNEPYFWDVGNILLGTGSANTTLKDVHDYTRHGADNITAWQNSLGMGTCKLANLDHGLPPLTSRFKPVVADVSAIYSTWISWRAAAIKKISSHFLVTVGFNTVFSMLPDINKQLDFTAHHIYPTESRSTSDGLPNMCLHNYSATLNFITGFDRLRASVSSNPGPVSYGEFGSSSGHFYRSSLHPSSKRKYLSFRTQALTDIAVFMYAFTSGADGGLHWRLDDHPLPFSLSQCGWIGDDSVPSVHAKYVSEGRFGLYFYDGTTNNRRKPLAEAMSFLGPYLAKHADDYFKFRWASWDAPISPIHLEWNVTGLGFLACGGSRADAPGLSFTTEDDGVVLFANWSSYVTLFAASDVRVRLTPSALSPPVPISLADVDVVGKHGGTQVDSGALVIDLLGDERVDVSSDAGGVHRSS